jgi:crotonobetainyl-CoA:carnitine CoA-transferase CaiB-like acyl-CoA transferase
MNRLVQQKGSAFVPLIGIRVVEVSTRVSGAYSGRLLADMGADVTRLNLEIAAYAQPKVRQALLAALHRRKNTVQPADAETLVPAADILIVDVDHDHWFAHQAEHLIAHRGQGTVLTRLSDFGRSGDYASWPSTALTVSAWTAASWATGDPEREPLTIPVDIPDYLAGTHAAGVSILGLLQRQAQDPAVAPFMEVASADILGYIVGMIATNFIPYGRAWRRDGPRATQSGGSYPGAIFRAADGPVSVMCRQQREWAGLLEAMGSPNWSAEERFADPRVVARDHSEEADSHLKPWVAEHTVAELLALGEQYGFPVAPIRDVRESLKDAQLEHRHFFEDLSLGGGCEVRVPGRPYTVTDGPHPNNRPSPNGSTTSQLPLSGLRILDLTWVWSGPMVTSALCDLGAEVIKVEHAKHPDPARVRGRGLRGGVPVGGPAVESSPYFNQLGHGKKSFAVDMATEEGRDMILALARNCEIVIENMRPGVLDRRGLGYEALVRVNENVILMSMSTMGQTGPASQIKGYGVVMSGLAGLEKLVGYGADTMGLFNLALSDPNAGSHALTVLLAALLRKRQTGQGCWIDLSQTECTICMLTEPLLEAQILGEVVIPGNNHTDFRPHGHFRCVGADAWVAVSVRNQAQRDELARALTGWLGRPLRESLKEELRQWAANQSPEVAARELRTLAIPAAPVQTYESLSASGWFSARDFTANLDHPYLGAQAVVGLPWRVNGLGPRLADSAPLLGQHTQQVAKELLGLHDDVIEALVTAGTLATGSVSNITNFEDPIPSATEHLEVT